MAKTHTARPISSTSEFTSQVDIVVPFHGQYDLLMQLIQSLFKLTRSNYYRLILVDDCSPNPDFIMNLNQNAQKNATRLRQDNVVQTIRNEDHKGYGYSCRVGFEAGDSPYVCFLNSDCMIEDAGWLRGMGETLLKLKSQGVRMVSPMMNNPLHGDPAQKGEKLNRGEDDVVLSENSFLSLPCFMCHRELFSRVGGFLKEYPYANYEDEEFAARLKKHGYKQAVCRSSYIHHKGSATIHNLWKTKPQTRKIMEEENRNRCINDIKSLN